MNAILVIIKTEYEDLIIFIKVHVVTGRLLFLQLTVSQMEPALKLIIKSNMLQNNLYASDCHTYSKCGLFYH